MFSNSQFFNIWVWNNSDSLFIKTKCLRTFHSSRRFIIENLTNCLNVSRSRASSRSCDNSLQASTSDCHLTDRVSHRFITYKTQRLTEKHLTFVHPSGCVSCTAPVPSSALDPLSFDWPQFQPPALDVSVKFRFFRFSSSYVAKPEVSSSSPRSK